MGIGMGIDYKYSRIIGTRQPQMQAEEFNSPEPYCVGIAIAIAIGIGFS